MPGARAELPRFGWRAGFHHAALFLEACGICVPCVSCSTLEQKGVQAVHKQIAAEMETRYPAGEWLGGHMALPDESF